MKFRTILFTLFVLAPSQLFAAPIDFTRTLKVGMSGYDVKALQVVMNRDPETRVADRGAGSPGNETSYFGLATKRAVVRFQEKYREEILNPFGLNVGTGVVGQKTRNKFAFIYKDPKWTGISTPEPVVISNPVSVIKDNITSVAPRLPVMATTSPLVRRSVEELANEVVPWTPDMVVPPGVNPNSINLEYYIAVAREAGKKKGMNEQQLEEGERVIRERVASATIDYRQEFFKKAIIKDTGALSFRNRIEANIQNFLLSSGIVRQADALLVGLPFGGTIVYVSPCTCTGGQVWQIILIPKGPLYIKTQSYRLGTQLYGYYTLPRAMHVLGSYIPGDLICWDYWGFTCVIRFYPPSEGTIMPVTGSSL